MIFCWVFLIDGQKVIFSIKLCVIFKKTQYNVFFFENILVFSTKLFIIGYGRCIMPACRFEMEGLYDSFECI